MAEPAAEPRPPSLLELAARQGGVVTRRQLYGVLGGAAARRQVRAGEWQLVRRGAYAERTLVEAARTDPRLEHRLACAAVILLSGRDLVACQGTAAILHGLRLLDEHTGPPQLMIPRPPGATPAHLNGLLAAGLPAGHRQRLEGLPVTTRPRTVADLARTLDRPAAVVMADAALRAGVDRLEVCEVLADCRRWPGVADAVDALMFADRRAESALESLARVWFSEAGLPAPQLQIQLCHASDGRFVARVDFFWPAHRTVCEVDGRLKYRDEQRRDDSDRPPGDVLWHEKLREDAMRDLGLEVARGYWSDRADSGRALVERVRRAFSRGALRSGRPTYGVLTPR